MSLCCYRGGPIRHHVQVVNDQSDWNHSGRGGEARFLLSSIHISSTSESAINKHVHCFPKQTCGEIPNRPPLFPSFFCAGNGDVCVCVCAQRREPRFQLPVSSRQTPSARWGGFPNSPAVKTEGGKWETWLHYKHSTLRFFPLFFFSLPRCKRKNRSLNLKEEVNERINTWVNEKKTKNSKPCPSSCPSRCISTLTDGFPSCSSRGVH